MEQLPNIVRERLKAPAGGDHLDADLLTAFAEQALPDRERSRVLLHVSRCADCRNVLALAAHPATTASGSLDTARPARGFQWKVLRWGAAVACVVIVGSAVLLRRDMFKPHRVETASVREQPVAEQYAYQPAQQEAATKLRAQQAITPAMENGNEKDMGRLGDRVLKPPAPPRLPAAAPPAPVARATRGDQKEEIALGSMHASGSGPGVSGAVAAKPTGAWAGAPAQTVRDERKNPMSDAGSESRKVTDLATLGKASEMLEVEAASTPTEAESGDKKDAPGKAKAASNAAKDALSAPAVVAQNQGDFSAETVSQKIDRVTGFRRVPLSRWTISSDGRLQHSIDAGRTWQPVPVADKATFRALSANGPDVWVGGAAGLLYHSADSGANWTQVKPTFANVALTADIAAIEFTDLQHGKITTSAGEVWTTEDAGQTWRKQ
jgi:photosynthesis system II assembly factor YCF48-like protein/putative zinc finger protein